ncbi:MAG: PDZ domain-containing protein [Planctomycetes bacterium]|nr:PDZ domain-containing protein [Planctomycetota bacterium]
MNQHIQTRPLEPDGNSVYLDYGPQLPERYYQNKIVALVRDPECIFAYWELSAIDQLRIADFGLHNCKWILRVNNLSTNTPEDISLNTPADPDNIPADKGGTPLRLRQGNWYLKVYPDTQYQLEIGIFTPDGKYIPLVKSNIVTTPRKTRAGGVASISSYQTIPTLLILLAMLISSCATIPTQPTTKPEAQTLYTETGAWIGLVGKDSIKGIEIIDIYFNSPAQQASVKKGDIIVGCNNRKTTNTQELLATLQTQKPDDTVKIKLTRIEEQVTVISGTETTTITLDEFNKKYQDFIDKGSPPDKLTFTAGKKEVIKELDVKLATAPKVFRKVAPPSEPKPEMRGEKKAGWMGISMEPVKDLTKFGVQSSEFGGPLGHPVGGLKISSVSPSSPAEKGGLKVQDIVLKYDGNGFEGDDSKYREKMADYIKEKGSGAEITLTVLRVIDDAVITPPQKSDDIIKTVETRMTTPDTKTEDPEPNDKIHPELTSYTTPIEILARQIMTATNITDKSVEIPPLMAGYDDLIKRYTDDQKWDDGFRISDMRYMHRDPFKIPKICDDFLYDLVTKHPPLDTIIRRLDEPITDDNVAPVELETGISLEEHCDQLEKLLETADKYRREAFAGLTEDDYNFLQDNIIGFTERWVRDFHFSEPDEIAKRGETDKRVIQLCSYVNYQKLFTAGEILAYSLSPNYNDGLQKDIEAAGKDKEGILFSKDTPFGKIIISGKGNSRYLDQAAASPALMRGNAAIIIDLDGDDFYANRLGSSTKNQPFSIIIDYSGDDRYSSYENGSQGTGIMGIGILFDMDGDDTYIWMVKIPIKAKNLCKVQDYLVLVFYCHWMVMTYIKPTNSRRALPAQRPLDYYWILKVTIHIMRPVNTRAVMVIPAHLTAGHRVAARVSVVMLTGLCPAPVVLAYSLMVTATIPMKPAHSHRAAVTSSVGGCSMMATAMINTSAPDTPRDLRRIRPSDISWMKAATTSIKPSGASMPVCHGT